MANTTADKLTKLEATKSALKNAINGSGSTVGDKFSDYPIAVTNGKAGIAAAITEKGVATAADATFETMEANIRSIESGGAELVDVSFQYQGVYSGTIYYTNGSGKTLTVDYSTFPTIQALKDSIILFDWPNSYSRPSWIGLDQNSEHIYSGSNVCAFRVFGNCSGGISNSN